MVDFNDEPFLFNCMWQFLGIPDLGTHYFSKSTNTMNMLDQFMVSGELYYGKQGLKLDPKMVEIFQPALMATKKTKRPIAFEFQKKGKAIKPKGYSDLFCGFLGLHHPIGNYSALTMKITKARAPKGYEGLSDQR
jgi:hypothetical protein